MHAPAMEQFVILQALTPKTLQAHNCLSILIFPELKTPPATTRLQTTLTDRGYEQYVKIHALEAE
jgi:hypothetical protein